MQIHEIRNNFRRKKAKKIGRGGKRGTYSGKGQKGQKARAGHRIRPALHDTISRIPKLRGVKHKSLQEKPVVLNVGDLEKRLPGVRLITKRILLEEKFIRSIVTPVKILGEGEVRSPLTISGILLSRSAREKIEKAGGSIQK